MFGLVSMMEPFLLLDLRTGKQRLRVGLRRPARGDGVGQAYNAKPAMTPTIDADAEHRPCHVPQPHLSSAVAAGSVACGRDAGGSEFSQGWSQSRSGRQSYLMYLVAVQRSPPTSLARPRR